MDKELMKLAIEKIIILKQDLEVLIRITHDLKNFCNFYPIACFEKLQLMEIILQCELDPKFLISFLEYKNYLKEQIERKIDNDS